jgi:putative DNA primase/helicase
MNYHAQPPLTETEKARRAAVLSTNQRDSQSFDLAIEFGFEHPMVIPTDDIGSGSIDKHLYGQHAAEILRNCRRGVALALTVEGKLTAFREAATTLGEAVAAQWIPKNVMADRLLDIAVAHSWFGLGPEQIQDVISDAVQRLKSLARPAALRGVAMTHEPLGLEVVCMADVKPTSIDWLWPNWIAVGKVSVLAGDGGRGKSTILCDMAARTTTNDKWPDAAAASPTSGVIILAAEDDLADTLAPRLIAAGADMARVFVIRSVCDENQKRRGFNLQADLELLESEIRKRANIRLIIIDPVSSYLGRVDSHKNADVRAVLEPLGELAARMRVAIICNNHFSKGGGSANSRIIGSVAFVNQARAAFIVTPDEEDETRMLLIPSKMNIAPIRHGLAYRIEGCQIQYDGADIATSRIMYESTPITISADQALAALNGHQENRSDKSEAIDFLGAALRGGPVSAKKLKKDASDAGISPKSVRSAREALGIKPAKTGFEGGWVWSLPEDALGVRRCP